MDLYDGGTIPGSTPPASSATPVAWWSHSITPSRTGATLTVNIPATSRATFRVSAFPFGTQTGFYVYTTRAGEKTTLTLNSSLNPGRLYFYQIESGAERQIVGTGTFTTAS